MDYSRINSDGWMHSDSMKFAINPVDEDGEYYMKLGLRSDNIYPYMDLVLVVDRTIYPRQTMKSDTVHFDLVSTNGHSRGNGVNIYQYLFDVDTLYLDKGDSVSISIRHLMMQDSLKGISDIGIELRK